MIAGIEWDPARAGLERSEIRDGNDLVTIPLSGNRGQGVTGALPEGGLFFAVFSHKRREKFGRRPDHRRLILQMG